VERLSFQILYTDISLVMTNHPVYSMSRSRDPFFELWVPIYIFGMGDARHFKFGRQIDLGEY